MTFMKEYICQIRTRFFSVPILWCSRRISTTQWRDIWSLCMIIVEARPMKARMTLISASIWRAQKFVLHSSRTTAKSSTMRLRCLGKPTRTRSLMRKHTVSSRLPQTTWRKRILVAQRQISMLILYLTNASVTNRHSAKEVGDQETWKILLIFYDVFIQVNFI